MTEVVRSARVLDSVGGVCCCALKAARAMLGADEPLKTGLRGPKAAAEQPSGLPCAALPHPRAAASSRRQQLEALCRPHCRPSAGPIKASIRMHQSVHLPHAHVSVP